MIRNALRPHRRSLFLLHSPDERATKPPVIACHGLSTSTAVDLAYRKYGTTAEDNKRPPLLLLHGLFGQKMNWHSMAQMLHHKLKNQVYTVDLPNHGESPWTSTMRYSEMAADICELIESAIIPDATAQRVSVLGHSTGGKVAMHLAMKWPQLLDRLIISDISPRWHPTALHAQYPIAIKAMRDCEAVLGEYPNLIEARQYVATMLEPVVKDPALLSVLIADIAEKSDGRIGWRMNLSVISQFLEDLCDFDIPLREPFTRHTMVLVGGDSECVSADDRVYMKRMFPSCRFEDFPSCGHWIHLDDPRAFLKCVCDFLQ